MMQQFITTSNLNLLEAKNFFLNVRQNDLVVGILRANHVSFDLKKISCSAQKGSMKLS